MRIVSLFEIPFFASFLKGVTAGIATADDRGAVDSFSPFASGPEDRQPQFCELSKEAHAKFAYSKTFVDQERCCIALAGLMPV